MKRFYLDDAFLELFPEARVGIVVARGIDNTEQGTDGASSLLASAAEEATATFKGLEIAAHPAIAAWRDAYRAFGAKPSKHRSSVESLLRVALKGRFRSVNPLVDLYNATSLRHLLPCGGEDLGAMRGDLRLTRARGGERFVPLGGTDGDPPVPGEVVYVDDEGVVCRRWNWREAERTKLTYSTRDAFLCVESIGPGPAEALERALGELAAAVEDKLGGRTTTTVLDRSQPVLDLPTQDPLSERRPRAGRKNAPDRR